MSQSSPVVLASGGASTLNRSQPPSTGSPWAPPFDRTVGASQYRPDSSARINASGISLRLKKAGLPCRTLALHANHVAPDRHAAHQTVVKTL